MWRRRLRAATGRHDGRARTVWRLGVVGAGLQLIVLVAVSTHLWQRYDLTLDFATFHQAWQQIGSGHLDPQLTTFAYRYPNYGYPFRQSHLELAMWPLALLWPLAHSSLALLVIQDVAVAATTLAALRWGLDLVAPDDGSVPGQTRVALLAGGLLLALLVDPWAYWTAWYDFHFQPLAALCAVMAGRELWKGRRRGWLWGVATLCCGDVAATYVLALGASGLLLRRTRWRAAVAIVVAVGWLGLVSALDAGRGSTLADRYGYLTTAAVGSGLSGIAAVVAGIARHPHPALHVVASRWREVAKYPAAVGTVGVVSILGLPITVVVLGANALNASPVFVGATAAFQSEAAVVLTAVGGVGLLAWLTRPEPGGPQSDGGRRPVTAALPPRVRRAVAVAVGLAAVAQVLVTSATWTPRVRVLLKVPAATAARLDLALRSIPADAEVIASQGVIGRFGGHRWVYPFLDSFGDGQTVPVHARTVVVVLTDAGIELATPVQTAAAVRTLTDLGGRITSAAGGVTTVVWQPTTTQRFVHFAP